MPLAACTLVRRPDCLRSGAASNAGQGASTAAAGAEHDLMPAPAVARGLRARRAAHEGSLSPCRTRGRATGRSGHNVVPNRQPSSADRDSPALPAPHSGPGVWLPGPQSPPWPGACCVLVLTCSLAGAPLPLRVAPSSHQLDATHPCPTTWGLRAYRGVGFPACGAHAQPSPGVLVLLRAPPGSHRLHGRHLCLVVGDLLRLRRDGPRRLLGRWRGHIHLRQARPQGADSRCPAPAQLLARSHPPAAGQLQVADSRCEASARLTRRSIAPAEHRQQPASPSGCGRQGRSNPLL